MLTKKSFMFKEGRAEDYGYEFSTGGDIYYLVDPKSAVLEVSRCHIPKNEQREKIAEFLDKVYNSDLIANWGGHYPF